MNIHPISYALKEALERDMLRISRCVTYSRSNDSADIAQILREVGSVAYHKAVKLVSGPDYEWFRYMEETIQKHFVGPDCYWKPHGAKPRGCTKFFGNAWWVPFPPTLVGSLLALSCVEPAANALQGDRVRRRARVGVE